MTVAEAAALMGVCRRHALRLLRRRNDAAGGRLLRAIGRKRTARGEQASKWLVSTSVFRDSMRPDDTTKRDIEAMRVELVLIRSQLAALRREMRAIQPARAGANGT